MKKKVAFKEVTNLNDKWDFEQTNELEGILVAKEANVGPNSSWLYTIKKQDGSFVSVWGSSVLDNRFALIEPNSLIKLVYKGKVKNDKTGRSYHDFSVLVDDGTTNLSDDGDVS